MSEEPRKPLNPNLEAHKFKKGCTPWNKGKKMPKTTTMPIVQADSKGDCEEDGIIRYKVIKDGNSLSKNEFKGKLDNTREPTATSFIRTVIERRPERIDIDGRKYYDEKAYLALEAKLEKEIKYKHDITELMKDATDTLKSMAEVSELFKEQLELMSASRMRWRIMAAILMIIVVAEAAFLFLGSGAGVH